MRTVDEHRPCFALKASAYYLSGDYYLPCISVDSDMEGKSDMQGLSYVVTHSAVETYTCILYTLSY